MTQGPGQKPLLCFIAHPAKGARGKVVGAIMRSCPTRLRHARHMTEEQSITEEYYSAFSMCVKRTPNPVPVRISADARPPAAFLLRNLPCFRLLCTPYTVRSTEYIRRQPTLSSHVLLHLQLQATIHIHHAALPPLNLKVANCGM